MKAMKSLSMNKMLGGIKRRPTNDPTGAGNSQDAGPQDESPEGIASRSVRAFCESGGRDNSGDEVTFLPAIVDAAESSPAAAAECARIIRKYLNKDYSSRPSYQYNSIMLMRILADNPGMTFTRNVDKKFVDTAKELLRYGRDPSVRQMLMETLDSFEAVKSYDEGLGPIVEMWKKEKDKAYKAYGAPPQAPPGGPAPTGASRNVIAPPFNQHSSNYFSRHHTSKRLPEPVELANRLEEARTSAKLLQQVVACTPPAEVLSNDLIKEFSDRCLSASRSIQGYMTAENPAPDNDTMEALIDTNEQLQSALSQHQRAMLNARKHMGLGDPSSGDNSPPTGNQQDGNTPVSPIDAPGMGYGMSLNGSGAAGSSSSLNRPLPGVPSRKAVGKQVEAGGSSRSATATPRPEEDPFRDPDEAGGSSSRAVAGGSSSAAAGGSNSPRLAYETFNPGFKSAEGTSSSGAADRTNDVPRLPRISRDSESDLYSDSDDDRYKPPPVGGSAARAAAPDEVEPKSHGPLYRY